MEKKTVPTPQSKMAYIGRHQFFCAEDCVIEGTEYKAGYYFSTPYEDLEGPYAMWDEMLEAMGKYAKML
jgi:hypothetical protein